MGIKPVSADIVMFIYRTRRGSHYKKDTGEEIENEENSIMLILITRIELLDN